jgi:hypothetical protein
LIFPELNAQQTSVAYDSSLLFMSMSKLIGININIMDIKRHLWICLFILMLVNREMEWDHYCERSEIYITGTLDEGPSEKVQQNGEILMVESHKLDPRLLDEDLKPIQVNFKWHLHNIILEGNSSGLDQKNEAKRKAHGLENLDLS